MGIIFITGWLTIVAVIVLWWRRPWRARIRALLDAVYLIRVARQHSPRHAAPPPPVTLMQRWEYGIVGVDVCPRCGGPLGGPLGPGGGRCINEVCAWQPPPGPAPFGPAADPRELTFPSPATTARGWLTGACAPFWPPGAESGPTTPVPRTDGASVAPGAWHERIYRELADPRPDDVMIMHNGRPMLANLADLAAESDVLRLDPPRSMEVDWTGPAEPPPPEPELPPSGDWAPGTGPPSDDDGHCPDCGRESCTGEECYWPDQAHIARPEPPPLPREGWEHGAMRWAPSRRATAADAEHARDLADQDADAAQFIDDMDRARRAYVWQIRRGFLAARGLA